MNISPEKIYLQISPPEPWEDDFDFMGNHEGITWCEDKINESDIEYIRADIMEAKIKDKEEEIQLYKQSFETAFTLWESMATAGQLTINQKFNEVYDQLLKIKNL